MKTSFIETRKRSHFLAIDIGTETIKALIFQKTGVKRSGGYSWRYFDRFGVFDSRDFEKDILKKAILKTIDEACGQVQNKENLPVILGLPANILKSRVVFQSFKRSNPKKILAKQELKEIYQTVFEKTKQKAFQDSYCQSGILFEEMEFLHQDILEIKIDGYEVPDFLGYNGENLDFSILTTFLPRYHFQNFTKIFKDLDLKISRINHLSQNLIKAFKRDGIYLDVGGEITQIFLIKNGKLKMVDEFEIGGMNFSQTLWQTLGLTEERARILKERYSKKLLSEDVRKRMQEILIKIAEEWFRNLKSKLIISKSLLPSAIYIFGGASLLPEIEETLNQGDWGDLLFAGGLKTQFIYPKQLKITNIASAINSPKDINLLLLRYAL